jgi:hypothetical protein
MQQVLVPGQWIVLDVLSDVVGGEIATNDVFIIIALTDGSARCLIQAIDFTG